VNKNNQQAHFAVRAAINEKIQGSRHAVKLISQLVVSFLKMRSSNLAVIANSLETPVKVSSSYKQIQRFLKAFRWRASGFAELQLEMLGIGGTLDLVIDRTEWKFGAVWINILMVSVWHRGAAIPVGWKVFSRKGVLSGRHHVMVLRSAVERLGAARVRKVFGDREFAGREMFRYLFEHELDFCLRLKRSHLADGIAFKQLCIEQQVRVKLKIKRKLRVLGYEMAVSVMKLSESEYLICASREVEAQALAEYAKRWQIETLFGCLKSRGFNFEETHLTRRTRIERLTLVLSLAFCLALQTGEIKVKEKPLKQKNNARFERSVFRIGLDYLQNLLVNLHLPGKCREFNLLVNLLSCT
jgi:hypothetical protein